MCFPEQCQGKGTFCEGFDEFLLLAVLLLTFQVAHNSSLIFI